MAAVWRSVKEFDIDKNGFLQCGELESCFKEHFPAEMEGKSLVFMLRKYSTEQDKNLINYRKLKSQLYLSAGISVSDTTKSEMRNQTPIPSHSVSMLAGLKPALYADSTRKTNPYRVEDKSHNDNEDTQQSFFGNNQKISSLALKNLDRLPNLYDPK